MTKALLLLACLIFLAVPAAAHDWSTAWSQAQVTPERTAAGPQTGPVSGTVLWSDTRPVAFAEGFPYPLIRDGIVYQGFSEREATVGEEQVPSEGWLRAYRIKGGPGGTPDLKWKVHLNNSIHATPLVGGDAVYAAGVDVTSTLYALNTADGKERWRVPASDGAWISRGAALADGVLYFVDQRGVVQAIDPATGTLRWKTVDDEVRSPTDPVVSGDRVFFSGTSLEGCNKPCSGQRVWAFDRSDGSLHWSRDPTDAFTHDDAFSTGLIAAEGRLFVATDGVAEYTDPESQGGQHHPAIPAKILALSHQDGRILWSNQEAQGNFIGLAYHDGALYATNNNDHLYKFDARTGHQEWTKEYGTSLGTTIVVADGVGYFGGYRIKSCTGPYGPTAGYDKGFIHAVSLPSGEEKWRLALDKVPQGALAVSGGYVAAKALPIGPDCKTTAEQAIVIVGNDPGTHAPNAAPTITGFSPASGSADVPVTASLGWSGADADAADTLRYDVYFGTSNPPPLYRNFQASAAFVPEKLDTGQTYYWRVAARDPHGAIAVGPIQSFNVEGTLVPTPDATDSETGGTTTHGGETTETKGRRTPAPEAATVLLALALGILWRRRGGRSATYSAERS